MLDVIKKVMVLFSRRERRLFCLLTLMMVFVAFAEVFGISTFLILLRVLSEPQQIFDNSYLAWAYETFGFEDTYSFQVFLAGGVLSVIMLSLVIKAAGTYAIIRFATMRGFTVSSRLLRAYLHQPYSWFLERNSADVAKSVLAEVQNVMTKVVNPGTRLLSNLILATAIICFLIMVDPLIAIVSAVFLGGAYSLIYIWLRGRLFWLGKTMLAANKERFRITQEATGGFKEVKLMSLEDAYVARYRKPAHEMARNGALSQVMNQLPRYVLEALTYVMLFGVILVLILRNDGNMTAAIPVLGVFGVSVMRLLPALQQVYGAFASIRNAKPVLDHIHDDYTDAMEQMTNAPKLRDKDKHLPLKSDLVLKDVEFSYATAGKPAVSGMNISIEALSTIGIVGGTGAGKTTVVDLMLGLLTPEKGDVLVDGVPLTRENLRLWRRSIGYVPQSIYLTDATVAQNIAFGVPASEIDMEAVERAARTAVLHDFVMTEMPDQYETIVGERGVRLSGGQRQRIGIARALYNDPSLLILDEATAALDNLTETAVMEAVQNIRSTRTIIMIAHRLSTIRNCDRILLLERGEVASSGTYDELIENSETFRKMAGHEA